MPNEWLSRHIRRDKPDWEPEFALRSAVNWIDALSFEVIQEHGSSPGDQVDSCRRLFSVNSRSRTGNTPIRLAAIFAPLFHSLTFSVSLASLSERNANHEWVFPGAVVWWYYGVYHAFRSMLAAFDGREPDRHRDVVNSLNELRHKLPHPFDMVATHQNGEQYLPTLPKYPRATSRDLITRFNGTRSAAQGMLLMYLNGTAGWEVGRVKEKLRAKHHFRNFRTKEARRIRDESLSNAINFLNCAYRYRGKVNYRDSLFISYGVRHGWLSPDFATGLFIVARFSFLCALGYAERRLGQSHVRDFLTDARAYFRGRDHTMGEERFWLNL